MSASSSSSLARLLTVFPGALLRRLLVLSLASAVAVRSALVVLRDRDLRLGSGPRNMYRYLLLLVFLTFNLGLWYLYAVNVIHVGVSGKDGRDRDFFYTDEEDDGPLVRIIVHVMFLQ